MALRDIPNEEKTETSLIHLFTFIQAFIMANEKLCLKWNDFQNIVQTSFEELRGDNDFTDVTLASEDQSIKAHKVILSACSPFFKRLLINHPNPQPLIYMRGVKSNDLVAVVDFIYKGEANIFQEQLENFLALAEELELKGLRGSSEEGVNKEEPEHAKEYFDHGRSRTDVGNIKRNMNNEGPSLNHKSNKNALMPITQSRPKQNTLINPNTMATIESLIERRINGGFACIKCDFKASHKSHMKEHTEKHIEGLEYPCKSCNKILRTSYSFRKHKVVCQNVQ